MSMIGLYGSSEDPFVAKFASKNALLLSRVQARRALGNISNSTLKRLETSGRLTPVRMTASSLGRVYFRADEIHRFVDEMESV